MNANFDRCLKFVLQHEGGYSFDPDDPGGETNLGISKHSHPTIDIKSLTLAAAREIYKNEYWLAGGCHKLVWPYDLIVFDTAVNRGVSVAKILLQEYPGWTEYLLGRIALYAKISPKTKDKFLRGWINRVIDLYKEIKHVSI